MGDFMETSQPTADPGPTYDGPFLLHPNGEIIADVSTEPSALALRWFGSDHNGPQWPAPGRIPPHPANDTISASGSIPAAIDPGTLCRLLPPLFYLAELVNGLPRAIICMHGDLEAAHDTAAFIQAAIGNRP